MLQCYGTRSSRQNIVRALAVEIGPATSLVAIKVTAVTVLAPGCTVAVPRLKHLPGISGAGHRAPALQCVYTMQRTWHIEPE